MNLLIETLNAWADHALWFAWPMLWQSSLLIALLFTLDLLLRRKVRPAVRYALWLVVLVKLVLPPSLAFPTSVGWWLRAAKAAPVKAPPTTVVVTYGDAEQPALPAAPTPVFVAPPRPHLTPAAWIFAGMLSVGLGLLVWMLIRWRQVARDARRASAAPAQLLELLPDLRRPVRLRLTDQPQSPAVCGLFRPVIVMPRSLAEHLPAAQVRAVLLHELLHLRRGDVWINCAQALLQIVYWWHPLLWFANARIRRLREEAVDDAVMLALNDDAEAYAPTLLEVAKLALHRPLASLGFVGILESRSSLRHRIERLMDFRPPRQAGLTLGAVLAVIGFAALAVPMGKAPSPAEAPQSAGSEAATNNSPLPAATNDVWLVEKLTVSALVQDGKLLYEMGKLNQAQARLELALKQDPQNPAAKYYLNLVDQARLSQNGDKGHLLPSPVPSARTNLIRVSTGRQAILDKLDSIRLEEVSYDGLPLSEVVRSLSNEVRKRDPQERRIHFILNSPVPAKAPPETSFDPSAGLTEPATAAGASDLPSIAITIKPPLINVRLADVLDAIVKVANKPIKYSVEDYAVVFSARTGHEPPPLYVRTFKLDPNTFLLGLSTTTGLALTNGPSGIVPALRDLLAKAGVDLDPTNNPGKAIFYNDRESKLMVRATRHDIDIIEQKIAVLNTPPPQVNIKCKFVETPLNDAKNTGFDWYLGNMMLNNGAVASSSNGPPTATNPLGVFPANPNGLAPTTTEPSATNPLAPAGSLAPSASPPTLSGILTDPQYRVVIKALQQRNGTELLAQTEVTTISGRQAQMKTVDVKTVVTGIDKRALTPPGITTTNGDESLPFATESMEFGPTLDVTANVLADGYTIELTLLPTVLEFLGYENSQTNRVAVYINGKQKWFNPPLPKFQLRQMNTSVRVWDGQTVVLGGLVSETVNTLKDKVPLLGDLPLVGRLFRSESKAATRKNLLIFVTPTLVDPAGNRLHSEEDVPFTRNAIPPQPAR